MVKTPFKLHLNKNMVKSVHGHYSDMFEEEAKRIKKLYKEVLNIDITWVEATAIAGERSANAIWNNNKLKEVLAELRGIYR